MSRRTGAAIGPVVVLLAVATLAACGGDGDEALLEPDPGPAGAARPTTTAPGSGADGGAGREDLLGTSWVLDALPGGGGGVPVAEEATLRFDPAGRLAGSTGCNQFVGRWEAADGGIRLDPGATTMRACLGGDARAQEEAVLARLPRVRSATVDAGTLGLLGPDGVALLEYRAGLTGLDGTTWQVTGVNNGRGGLESNELTSALSLAFGEGGALSGGDGCGPLTGTWSADGGGDGLVVEVGAEPAAGCPGDVAELATQLRAALAATETSEVSGSSLTLRDGSGAMQVTATAGG